MCVTKNLESIKNLIKEAEDKARQEVERERLRKIELERQRRLDLERQQKEEEQRQILLSFMSGKKPGFIYLIRGENGFWKIGYAANPYNRQKTFNVKLPFDVTFEHLIPTNDMTKAEQQLHAQFAFKRVRGEWFDLSEEDIAWIKSLRKLDV